MILYKYRSNSEYTDQIFTQGKVWLARSATLNDPCECTLYSLAPDWVEKQVHQMKAAQMMGFLLGPPGSSPNSAAGEISARLRDTEGFENKYRAFREMYEARFPARLSDPDLTFSQLEDQLKDVGIFSLSETAEHPLMWSHYGANHEGVCLGFEVPDSIGPSDREHLVRVTYTDQVPRMENGFIQEIAYYANDDGRLVGVSRIPLHDPALRAAISTKALCWEYEREWRCINSKSGMHPYPGPLVEIVFGFRCTTEQRQHYSELAASHSLNDVRLFEMKRIRNSFTFERIPLDVLKPTRTPAVHSTKIVPRWIDETNLRDEYPAIRDQIEKSEFAGGLPAIEEALKESPDSSRLWGMKGVELGKLLRHEEALECFERATILNPRFFLAWYHRGVACSTLERYEDAVSAYVEALRLNPTDASSLYNMGCDLAHLGRTSDATSSLATAVIVGHPKALAALKAIQESSVRS